MKKVLLITLIAFSVSSFAQSQISFDQPKFKADESNTVDINKAVVNMKKRALQSFTFYPLNIALQSGNIFGFIENSCNGDFKSYVNFLYPDTTAVVISSNGRTAIYEHLIGNTFDPKDSNINNQNPAAARFSKFTQYTVDSMVVRFGYHRHLDSAVINSVLTEVVDTLVFQFFNLNQLTYNSYTASGFESFAYPIKTSFNLPALTSSNAAGTYKLPLTKDYALRDSTTGWVTGFFNIPVGVTINPNGTEKTSFSYTMVFRPMVKTSNGDTVFHQDSDNTIVHKKNNYLTYFFTQNEATPVNKSTQTMQFSYYNNSFFTPKTLRYGATQNGWSTFIPGNAYFSHQYVHAFYNVSTSNLAVKNTSKDVNVIEAYPNPAKENSEVIVRMNSNRATTAVVTLTDMTGKVIKTMNIDLASGANNISIATEGLSVGMYLINIAGSDFESSSKLVIE